MLDIAKGLGILLVVLGHSGWALQPKGELYRVIYSFHMPLFFLLGGIFLKPAGRFTRAAASRAAVLLRPYLLVAAVVALAQWARQALGGGGDFSLEQHLANVVLGGIPAPRWTPLWFLPHLFLASLVALALLKADAAGAAATRWARVLAVAAAYGAGAISLAHFPHRGWPWSADLLLLSVPLMLLGFMLREHLLALRFRPGVWALALVVFAGLHGCFDDTLDLNERRYTSVAISTVQALAGMLLLLQTAAALAAPSWIGRGLAHVGQASLVILVFHMFLQSAIHGLATQRRLGAFAANLLACLLCVVLSLLIHAAARRSVWGRRLLLPAARA